MPLIEVTQTRRVTAHVRFNEPVVAQINQYAAFIGATPDEVINKGLEYLFEKDRDFAAFRATDKCKDVPELLKARRPGGSRSSRTSPKKPSTGVESVESVAVRRA
jgi:hypothetical protein